MRLPAARFAATFPFSTHAISQHEYENAEIEFIRLYETEHLMLTDDISIAEASYACGFSDPKYFYPAFKEWYGRTPKEHRNWYRDFMKQETDMYYPNRQECFEFLEKYITEWFLRDTVISQK